MERLRSGALSPLSTLNSPLNGRGFTIIELLTVIAMVGVVVAMAVPFLSSDLTRNDARNFSSDATDALREAQASVMSGRNGARFGVHFEATKFVVFQGATYASNDANNVVHSFSALVSVTAVTLAPGGSCTLPAGTGNCDIHFSNHKGTPTETGAVVFSGVGGETATVTINDAGMIDVQ
ncbi:MAG TPA: prepilin-type N-terminal cleavage/methylation domain-containing protein [Candidatus Eisenbacteria bacterium]|nr:prepilin-type N-terminal cleavage/methylation domain-containing protein [Candidatus Eisenbacteria bacterium]